MKNVPVLLVLVFLGLLFVPATTSAARSNNRPGGSTSSTPLGNDVSWPQCGKKLPTTHAFGIVGVNGGLANTTNPCLKDQLVWAGKAIGGTSQEVVQLYVNTANPGGLGTPSWPSNNIDPAGNPTNNPFGTCNNGDDLACAWQYGWNRAVEDVITHFMPAINQTNLNKDPSHYIWWLDVETENSWKLSGTTFDHQSNVATLEGMTAYFKTQNIRVGLYSTAYQWGEIAGDQVSSTSNLNGLPNWRPGGASLSTAKQACTATPLTTGGQVVLTQFVSKNLDYNYSCIN